MGATNTFTYTLTNSTLSISSSNNVTKLSVMCKQGTISYLGSLSFQGLSSTSITFSVGQGVTESSASTSQPLDGILITAGTAGDIAEIILTTT